MYLVRKSRVPGYLSCPSLLVIVVCFLTSHCQMQNFFKRALSWGVESRGKSLLSTWPFYNTLKLKITCFFKGFNLFHLMSALMHRTARFSSYGYICGFLVPMTPMESWSINRNLLFHWHAMTSLHLSARQHLPSLPTGTHPLNHD